MSWISDTQKAINYIEDNILNEVNVENVSEYLCVSKDYFQKVFYIITGFSITEYIRNRRLSLAGKELSFTDSRIIDIALKYGYETPESFTKAFTRFHGSTPSEIKNKSGKLNIFIPLTIQIDVKGGFVVSRRLIPNVEKLYENGAENYMFCSCMRSVMAALNENKDFDFSFFAGITGDFFTQIWGEPKWQYNDSYSTVARDTGEPIKAAFNACGYEYEYYSKQEISSNQQKFIGKIVDSIDKGFPVLTFGIVGPPICSIIFGYDENGDILIGWSQFTDEPKEENPLDLVVAENYFQVRNGLDRSNALIFFGKKRKTPAVEQSIKDSLLNIHKFSALPQTKNIHFGKKAFDDWADSLLCDEYFATEEMLAYPLDTYGSCIVMVGSNMHGINRYLERALELCPDINEYIIKLQNAFNNEMEALQKLVDYQSGYFFDANRKALLNKDFRIGLADHIREIGKCYEIVANISKENVR
ncbi:MAG: transcriptional regulator, AraC family [Clostridia bacterium]|nr:transcriptional regulator, AraC family [Clostridia bacterium]